MGLFNFFSKKEQPPSAVSGKEDLLEKVEVIPGIILPRALARHWNEIEKTKLPFISISASPSEDLTIHKSSFGYYPCLPKGYAYPTDKDGHAMFPLAQINCSDLPVMQGYPQFGYLQFYISPNDTYGIDFDNLQSQTSFRVLYFEENEIAEYKVDFPDDILGSEFVPIVKPHKLEFKLKEEYFGVGDVRAEEGPFYLPDIAGKYPYIAEELEEYVWDTFATNGHKMGGYAYFTQSDPRTDATKDYVLLLQIDSGEHIT
jgi:uncharacterized protein YwqG